jgi:hypothetical protein
LFKERTADVVSAVPPELMIINPVVVATDPAEVLAAVITPMLLEYPEVTKPPDVPSRS